MIYKTNNMLIVMITYLAGIPPLYSFRSWDIIFIYNLYYFSMCFQRNLQTANVYLGQRHHCPCPGQSSMTNIVPDNCGKGPIWVVACPIYVKVHTIILNILIPRIESPRIKINHFP